jgi:Ni,Fe-hydrogenase I cytochrome b subunit
MILNNKGSITMFVVVMLIIGTVLGGFGIYLKKTHPGLSPSVEIRK